MSHHFRTSVCAGDTSNDREMTEGKQIALRVAGLGRAMALGLLASGAPAGAAPRFEGYLDARALETTSMLPPAPSPGSPRDVADRAVFTATRVLEDGPRWRLARRDDDSSRTLEALSCATGVLLTARNAPRTYALLGKVGEDAVRVTEAPKQAYRRPRPFLRDDGPICIAKSEALRQSYDYPSGHSTWGWAVGLILAELEPDRADKILFRARAFGESRLVCGVHSFSAVEAGRVNASILVSALHGEAAFRRDLQAARREIGDARRRGPAPDPKVCKAEADILGSSSY